MYGLVRAIGSVDAVPERGETLRIGKAIPTEGMKLHDREALTGRLYHEIAGMLKQAGLTGACHAFRLRNSPEG